MSRLAIGDYLLLIIMLPAIMLFSFLFRWNANEMNLLVSCGYKEYASFFQEYHENVVMTCKKIKQVGLLNDVIYSLFDNSSSLSIFNMIKLFFYKFVSVRVSKMHLLVFPDFLLPLCSQYKYLSCRVLGNKDFLFNCKWMNRVTV